MRRDVLSEIDELAETIGEEISIESGLWRDPEEYLDELVDGDEIESLGDPRVYRDDRRDLYEDLSFDSSVGVDASSTRTLVFDNGILLCLATAGVGTVDVEIKSDLEIICGTNLDLPGTVQIPRTDLDDYAGWITSVTQHLAESRCLGDLPEFDGVVFLDGYLYPSGLRVERDEDLSSEIYETYVRGVERQIQRGNPVVAVTKSMTRRQLLDEMGDVRWESDVQWVSDLLGDAQDWTSTGWFREKSARRPDDPVNPVEGFCEGDPENLRRCFFFAREPRTGHVYRVQTPSIVVEDSDRDRLRRAILAEMCETSDVPEATKRADSEVYVSSDLRDRVARRIEDETGASLLSDYDRDVRTR